MKFLVLLAAVGYASAASSNAVTCEECQAVYLAVFKDFLVWVLISLVDWADVKGTTTPLSNHSGQVWWKSRSGYQAVGWKQAELSETVMGQRSSPWQGKLETKCTS